MKTKMELNPETLREWMSDMWTLYASQMFNGKLLRLHINGSGVYRITHGETVLYQGNQMTHALAAWAAA